MRLLLLWVLTFGLVWPASAGPIEERLAEALAGLEGAPLRTGILYDRVLPLSGIERFDGGPRAATVSLPTWRQLYDELRRASSDPEARPDLAALLDRARSRERDGVIPIALVHDRYQRIRPDALERGALVLRDGRLEPGVGDPFAESSVFAAAALRDYSYRGAEVAFAIDRSRYFTSAPVPLRSLALDFGDGRGLGDLGLGEVRRVRYPEPGRKVIRVQGTLADGTVLHASFDFEVRALAVPAPHDTLPITATIPYQGSYGTGEAYVYRAAGRATLVNPVVVVEGFDLDNTMNWDELYAQLNQENLIEDLRAAGYDAVVLNFTDATEAIQKNAFVLAELLDRVEAQVGPATVALVGASMGGLVGRYALAYLESQSLGHAVRTFVSFDVPHLGANIPLGIQYWVKFFAGQSAEAAYLLSRLDRPAARQMLVYHYTDPPGTTGQADALRGTFLADLAALGNYPAGPRLVAIANGSGHQAGQGFAPGDQIILYSYSSLFVTILGNVWAVPDASSHIIFDGRTRILFSDTRQSVTVSGTRPYDNAPGGSRATMADMDSVTAPYGDIVALHPSHCFIPTVSALGVATSSLFHDIANDPALPTPFDAVYFPAVNQEHVAITPQNAAWLRSEIESGVTAVSPGSGPSAPGVAGIRTVAPNPFAGRVRIAFELPRAAAVDLRVFDLQGRETARLAGGRWTAGRHEAWWHGRDTGGGRAPDGVYFVRFEADGRVETRRVVKVRW